MVNRADGVAERPDMHKQIVMSLLSSVDADAGTRVSRTTNPAAARRQLTLVPLDILLLCCNVLSIVQQGRRRPDSV
jgi:hypothetical protein